MANIIINEELKGIIGKDLETISAKLPEGKDFVLVPKEDHIPKSRFDEVNTTAKDYKTKYEDINKQYESLKPLANGNEELTKKIKELQDLNAKTAQEYEGKLTATKRDYLLNDTLKGAKARNPRAVSALLDHTKIVLKDDKLDGIDEQLEALKKSDPYLFTEEEKQNPAPFSMGLKPGSSQNGKGNGLSEDPIARAMGIKAPQK